MYVILCIKKCYEMRLVEFTRLSEESIAQKIITNLGRYRLFKNISAIYFTKQIQDMTIVLHLFFLIPTLSPPSQHIPFSFSCSSLMLVNNTQTKGLILHTGVSFDNYVSVVESLLTLSIDGVIFFFNFLIHVKFFGIFVWTYIDLCMCVCFLVPA